MPRKESWACLSTWTLPCEAVGEGGRVRGGGGVLAELLCVSILFYFPIYEMG